MSGPAGITQKVQEIAAGLYKPLAAYPRYVEALLKVKEAAAICNARSQVIDPPSAELIREACQSLSAHAQDPDTFPVDVLFGGGQIAINMNINEAIAAQVRKAHGSHLDPKTQINASQSTADVCHTASHIAILSEWSDLESACSKLVTTFAQKEREFQQVTTRARTCLRDAMPVSLGSLFQGYAHAVGRCQEELSAQVRQLEKINLGGTVIGSSQGASPEYLKQIVSDLCSVTGLKLQWRQSLFDAAQNADDLGRVCTEVSLLARTLIKIAKDVRLMSSGPRAGFDELRLHPVMSGSSFFKDKVNPVLEETVILGAMQAIGLTHGALSALDHAELNLNVFEGLLTFNILESLAILQKAVSAWNVYSLAHLSANQSRCETYARET